MAADLNDGQLSQALVLRPGAEHPAIVRDQLLTLVPQERLAHGVDEQAVEARTLDPLEDDLVEVSEPAWR